MKKAVQLARRNRRVPLNDLVQVGVEAVLQELPKFKPGLAGPGKSLLPGWAAKIASRAMSRWARDFGSPVTVSKHGWTQHRDAQRESPDLGPLVSAISVEANDLDFTNDDAASVEDQLIEHQLLQLLPSAVGSLPGAQREILQLTYGIGTDRLADDRRIAKRLGLAVDEVHGHRQVALAALRQQLE